MRKACSVRGKTDILNSMTETSEIWTGEALSYDRARPTPPPALLDLLTQLIDMPHPALVVDVGSGTGLSTAIWGERAAGDWDRTQCRYAYPGCTQSRASSLRGTYRSIKRELLIGLACPMRVLISSRAAQSFHWMEPTSTLAEIARILRPGGLFAAYDYDLPPALNWELEQVYQEVDQRFDELAPGAWTCSATGASRNGRRRRISTACVTAATSASHARCFFIISSKETRHAFLR